MSRGFMYGKLDPSKKVIEATREEWSRSFEDPSSRVVEQTGIGEYLVSTVFLGLNHAFMGGQGIWFETMVFEPAPADRVLASVDQVEVSGFSQRYRTWEEASQGHQAVVRELEERFGKPKRAPTEQELTRYGFRKMQIE